ncbi:hypothetical protein P691DRAFT_808452 [Macrolepiota fuliginosa MF-IS2]|uniref:Defect at low temperature protein 1 n=1 Tax=Macrolepiota fuliginosa MF-IS2 TaxID=1400762 RepID=A0A9P5X5F9_9AGAR|nr:hypothetical protein P691DRAFT_808452 [Macrolepiota fuliginosa MF-IS2]
MLSPKLLRTISETSYALLVLLLGVATGLSCTALLSQAVRTSPTQNWRKNFNALVIGASYIVVLAASLLICVKRRVAVRLKLQRISKTHKTLGQGDLPKSVHRYITQEYYRACLVSYESLPKEIVHEGWGRPGSPYAGQRFRRVLLDTISEIDALARTVIPLQPQMKPHARMLHHFRFIAPLLPQDEDKISPLLYYDTAIQIARISERELTEEEYLVGMRAAEDIIRSLELCRPDRSDASSTQLNDLSGEYS